MESFQIYGQVVVPYLGIVIAIALLLPIVLIFTIFKPKNVIQDNKVKKTKFEKYTKILEKITGVIIIILLCISRDNFNLLHADIWLGIMLFFFVLYYELFIRYIISGCEYKNLYLPFIYIKVPMAVCICFAIIFASIWGRHKILFVASLIFAFCHIFCEYKVYCRNFKNSSKEI